MRHSRVFLSAFYLLFTAHVSRFNQINGDFGETGQSIFLWLKIMREGASIYIWRDKMVYNYLVIVANAGNYSRRSGAAMVFVIFSNYKFRYFDGVYSFLLHLYEFFHH